MIAEYWLPVWQTIAMASLGTLVALVLGTPVAVAIAARVPGYRILATIASAVRSIPDLTLAILAVVVVGIGPAAGALAMAIFYTVTIAKGFALLLATTPPRAMEALRSTGATPLRVAVAGAVPDRARDLISFASYAFECALRASTIVGAVGAGGIGTEIVGAINAFDWPRLAAWVGVLLLLVWAVDVCGALVRRMPLAGLAIIPLAIAGAWSCVPAVIALGHAASVAASMWPPSLSGRELARLPQAVLETLGMALVSTAIAALLAFAVAPFAARRFVPPIVWWPLRRTFDVFRAMPEVMIGLIIVVWVGVGPLAGTLALMLHTFGVLAKLDAEAVENLNEGPLEALRATGAAPLVVAFAGALPLAAHVAAEHAIFRIDWNVRWATVIGAIGAGGIGEALYEAQQTFHYHEMFAYVLITWLIVGAVEFASERVRLGTSANRYLEI